MEDKNGYFKMTVVRRKSNKKQSVKKVKWNGMKMLILTMDINWC